MGFGLGDITGSIGNIGGKVIGGIGGVAGKAGKVAGGIAGTIGKAGTSIFNVLAGPTRAITGLIQNAGQFLNSPSFFMLLLVLGIAGVGYVMFIKK